MMTSSKRTRKQTEMLLSDENTAWQAVIAKDVSRAGEFFYAVKTTGIYCRIGCPARLPLRRNVSFHLSTQAAEAAGFRPCQRCHPDGRKLSELAAEKIAQACRLIESADSLLPLVELAEKVGLSPYHFHRLFKAQTGLTPKAYATGHRTQRVRDGLRKAPNVTQAMYTAGFNSSSRFYENSNAILGMLPSGFRDAGCGASIRFAVGECWLGSILVAASGTGICAISIGDEPELLIHDLEKQFANAELIGGDHEFENVVATVVGFVNDPSLGLDLPLDIRGTAFQQRVWKTLQQVPIGSTATYTEIAERIGQPRSIRAVAGACAANRLAVAIPCHRVIRTDGSLSGYRWGVERKNELLKREQQSG